MQILFRFLAQFKKLFYLCKLKEKQAFCPYFRLKWKQKTEFDSLWRTNT